MSDAINATITAAINAAITALPAENGEIFFDRTVRLTNATKTVVIEIDKEGAWYVESSLRKSLTMELLREMFVIWFSQEEAQC